MPNATSPPALVVRVVCEHNLRTVDIELLHQFLVSVSDLDGSGKTSLILDAIYAEAHCRFPAALDQGSG